jgi:hypothetical protein
MGGCMCLMQKQMIEALAVSFRTGGEEVPRRENSILSLLRSANQGFLGAHTLSLIAYVEKEAKLRLWEIDRLFVPKPGFALIQNAHFEDFVHQSHCFPSDHGYYESMDAIWNRRSCEESRSKDRRRYHVGGRCKANRTRTMLQHFIGVRVRGVRMNDAYCTAYGIGQTVSLITSICIRKLQSTSFAN